jgi:hypothetical protein
MTTHASLRVQPSSGSQACAEPGVDLPRNGSTGWPTGNVRARRTGNRQLNTALHRMALTQTHWRPPAKAMMQRRKANGDSGLEVAHLETPPIRRRLYSVTCRPRYQNPSTRCLTEELETLHLIGWCLLLRDVDTALLVLCAFESTEGAPRMSDSRFLRRLVLLLQRLASLLDGPAGTESRHLRRRMLSPKKQMQAAAPALAGVSFLAISTSRVGLVYAFQMEFSRSFCACDTAREKIRSIQNHVKCCAP